MKRFHSLLFYHWVPEHMSLWGCCASLQTFGAFPRSILLRDLSWTTGSLLNTFCHCFLQVCKDCAMQENAHLIELKADSQGMGSNRNFS